MGAEINNSSISAIVEDLSKKNKGKYLAIGESDRMTLLFKKP